MKSNTILMQNLVDYLTHPALKSMVLFAQKSSTFTQSSQQHLCQ